MSDGPALLRASSVLWEHCVSKTWKVNNPFGDDWEKTLRACVSIVESDGHILIQIEADGHTFEYDLTDTCYDIQYYIFQIEVCISNLVIDANRPKRFDIVINGCVGTEVFGIELEECVRLYRQRVQLFRYAFTDSEDGPMLPSSDGQGSKLPYMELEVPTF